MAGRFRNTDWSTKKGDFDYMTNSHHNQQTLDGLQEGDLVRFQRAHHEHWGVYIGREQVVHLVGWDSSRSARTSGCFVLGSQDQRAKIVQDYYWDVAGYDKADKANERDKVSGWRSLSPHTIVDRAKGKLGDISYNSFLDCEKFAMWCRYDKGSGPNFDHNTGVLRMLRVGDLVTFQRTFYKHWAVYIGEEQVIHLVGVDERGVAQNTSLVGRKLHGESEIVQDNFWDVAKDTKASKVNMDAWDQKCSPFTPSKIVERAKGKLGKDSFHFLTNNCEHFAMWCRYDKKSSDQSGQALFAVVGTAALAFHATLAFPVTAGALALGAVAGYFFSKKDDDSKKDNDSTKM